MKTTRAVVRVEDFIDTYPDDRQEILEGYIDGTGWKMQEDCGGAWCPELERLFENAEIDPVVFTKGNPTPERILDALRKYYKIKLNELAKQDAEEAAEVSRG